MRAPREANHDRGHGPLERVGGAMVCQTGRCPIRGLLVVGRIDDGHAHTVVRPLDFGSGNSGDPGWPGAKPHPEAGLSPWAREALARSKSRGGTLPLSKQRGPMVGCFVPLLCLAFCIAYAIASVSPLHLVCPTPSVTFSFSSFPLPSGPRPLSKPLVFTAGRCSTAPCPSSGPAPAPRPAHPAWSCAPGAGAARPPAAASRSARTAAGSRPAPLAPRGRGSAGWPLGFGGILSEGVVGWGIVVV